MANHSSPSAAVIFDLGRVAVHVDFRRGLLKHLTSSTLESEEEVIARLYQNELFVEFNSGRIDPPTFHQRLMALTGLSLAFNDFVAAWCDIFSMSAEMDSLIRRVSLHNAIGILSDTDPLHWGYLRRTFPVLQIAPKPTLSFEVGAMKPSPEIFQAAIRNMNCRAEECFFIDDLERNVEGARRAGINAVLFQGPEALETTLRGWNLLP